MEFLLFLSMFIYMLYIFCLNFVNFVIRGKAVKEGQVSPKYFKTYQGEAPERVVLHTRHNDNQYQAPILFLIIGSLSLALGDVSLFSVIFSWCFVLSRFVHSYFLLNNKNILNRVKSFLLGWVFILLMWVVLGFNLI